MSNALNCLYVNDSAYSPYLQPRPSPPPPRRGTWLRAFNKRRNLIGHQVGYIGNLLLAWYMKRDWISSINPAISFGFAH